MKCRFLPLLFLVITHHLAAQSSTQDFASGRVSPKELTIPPSPVFDLMGVTPSQVNRTSDIKDFKVDWSFRSWKMSPNLAIQSQPFWEILYNRKNLQKYQQASSFMRRLASLDVSIGSVQNEEDDRRIGFAAKMNLYKQKDPLLSKEMYTGIDEKYAAEKVEIEKQLQAAVLQLDTTLNVLQKPQIRSTIKALEEQLFSLNSRRREEVNSLAKIFVSENWNASSLDVAIGRVYTYKTDSAGSLTSLRLNRNTGWGTWVNGSVGIGKRILVTGLFRTTWYQEELNFNVQNATTGEEESQKAVAENKLFTMGLNLRYGSPVYTFFVEVLFERKALKTPMDALQEAFTPASNFKIVSSTVKWDVVHPNTISFGGDWRISNTVILNYGVRCIFNNQGRIQTVAPIAAISCMMR